MFDAAFAQLRLTYALATGRRLSLRDLDRVTKAMCETVAEFGAVGDEAANVLRGPALDPEVARGVATTRFRTQAVRAVQGTRHYRDLFARLGVDPGRLSPDDIARLPVTTKEQLRSRPSDFVHAAAQPVARIATTATTGSATTVHYSEYELGVISALTAQHILLRRLVRPDDVVALCISSRASLAVGSLVSTATRIGAVAHLIGLVEPGRALAELSSGVWTVPGGRLGRATVLNIYPSFLGELVEAGLAAGLGPGDFAIDRIMVGGEIVTDGLLRRVRSLFGDVLFAENCAMTEIAPAGGTPCSAGHLHLEPTTGMVEVLSLDASGPAEPGELGTLVVTPFPPYRETTLLLRYDTEDVVRPVGGPLDCELSHLPATSRIEGKRRLGALTDDGWTFQRPIQEALEALPEVPLPARYACTMTPAGLEVGVRVRSSDGATRRAVREHLEGNGVSVARLELVTDARALREAMPVRADLRERSFEGAR